MMGSIGRQEQAFGQAQNGYEAGKWDLFGVNTSIQDISTEISRIHINDNTDRNILTTINALEEKLDTVQTKYNNTPEPDIMSSNQVQEARDLQRAIDTQRKRLAELQKQFNEVIRERHR